MPYDSSRAQQEDRLPRWCGGKESTCQCRRCKRYRFHPWLGRCPEVGNWQPDPLFLPGESHEQRSLVSYSPWSHKELEMTQYTHTRIQQKETLFFFMKMTKPGKKPSLFTLTSSTSFFSIKAFSSSYPLGHAYAHHYCRSKIAILC